MTRLARQKNTLLRPVGALVTPAGVDYRLWAPDQKSLYTIVQRADVIRQLQMEIDEEGYWFALDAEGRAGDLYNFKLQDGRLLPDVASRFQPQGVHGPSECVDASDYKWRCNDWKRPIWSGQTIYEVHVGTFTEVGTYRAAMEKLKFLLDLGVEAIEIMPVADFDGNRNWGYDGVALYAPARCYGRPDDLRVFVDAVHDCNIAVILDVVYNHIGPSGNYLSEYSSEYFIKDKTSPWGQSFNLDGERSQPVRDFIIGNAIYWLDEFRFDGLRLDATHAISDRSPRHLLAEIAAAVHARGGFLIAEDERNDTRLLRLPDGEGFGLDAVWSDDFHHQVRVALTGTRESYFSAYGGSIGELSSTLKTGWTYRGDPYEPWEGRGRGSPCDHLPESAFIYCIENHDQVGNRAAGERLEHLVTPRQFRAASMLLCLSPYVPMIFMGQEWAASTPFLFFTDFGGELGGQISQGRRSEFSRHNQKWGSGTVPDPEVYETFKNSKLQWEERERAPHAGMLELYRECLNQRRICFRESVTKRNRWRVFEFDQFLALLYQTSVGERLLLVALTDNTFVGPVPEELTPPLGYTWKIIIQSEAGFFGGGERFCSLFESWKIEGPGAVWLAAVNEESYHAAS